MSRISFDIKYKTFAFMLKYLQSVLECVNMKQPPQYGKALKRL